MRLRLACLLMLCLLVLPGCLYSSVTVPLDTDLQETDLGDKIGKSYFQCVLGLFAWGDSGMQAAAENGGITTLKHADREILVVLFGLVYKQTTVVYGK